MASQQTFIDRELILPAFVADLRQFLSLPPDALLALAEISGAPESSPGFQQADLLRSQADISLDEAASHLRVASHLFHSAVQSGLAADEAVDQLISAASAISEPIELGDDLREALTAIFSSERGEVSYPVSKALADGPHFIEMDGSWSIKPVKVGDGEIVAVPVLSIDILWHDQSGTRHEAFFQMSESEWESFREEVEEINDFRQEIEHFLEGSSSLSPDTSEND